MSGEGDVCVDLISELKTSHDTQLSPPPSLLIFSAWVGPGLLIVKGPQDPQASHLHQTGQSKKRSCLLGGFFFFGQNIKCFSEHPQQIY